jgi:hypothetical protein
LFGRVSWLFWRKELCLMTTTAIWCNPTRGTWMSSNLHLRMDGCRMAGAVVPAYGVKCSGSSQCAACSLLPTARQPET